MVKISNHILPRRGVSIQVATNEELATLAAQGDTESLHKLYFAVAPLIYKITSRYFKFCETSRNGVRLEDLTQCGYFAYLDALKYYSPEKGFLFNTYLSYCVRKVCLEELGFRGKKQVETVSLDAPIFNENEELTLGDTIPDPNANTAEYAELNDMQILVRREIDRLPIRNQIVIYGVFYENKTLEQIAEERGWERGIAHMLKHSSYKQLRRSEVMWQLAKAYTGVWTRDSIEHLDEEGIAAMFEENGLTPIGGSIWD